MSKSHEGSKKIELSTRTSASDVAGHLQQIVNGLQSGAITVHHSEETMTMSPGEAVAMRFRAKQKDGVEGVRIDLDWERPASPEALSELQIGNGEGADEPGEEASGGQKAKQTKQPTKSRKRKNSRKS